MAANNWFKASKKLPRSAKVLRLMELLGRSKNEILGELWVFWAWVDDHAKGDRLRARHVALLSQICDCDILFLEALMDPEICWLGRDNDGLFIPRWSKWFGSKQKERESNTHRQRKLRRMKARQANDDGHGEDEGATTSATNGATSQPCRALDQTRPDQTRPDQTRLRPDQTKTRPDLGTSDSLRASTSNVLPGDVDADVDAPACAGNGTDEETPGEPTPGVDWQAAKVAAADATKRLGIRQQLPPEDRSLIFKVAVLAQLGRLSENELADSIEAVVRRFKKPDKPKKGRCAYWHGTLDGMLRERERPVELNALLAPIVLPPRKAVTA